MTTCLHSKFNEQLKGGKGFEHSPFQNTRENGICEFFEYVKYKRISREEKEREFNLK